MEARCIKTYGDHWVSTKSIFSEGKWYDVLDSGERATELIINSERYFHYIRIISGSVSWIRKGYTEDQLPSVIPEYLTHKQVRDRYIKTIFIPTYTVKGDAGIQHEFCSYKRQELIDMYGSCKFRCTEKFFNDYFELRHEVRDNLIDDILK